MMRFGRLWAWVVALLLGATFASAASAAIDAGAFGRWADQAFGEANRDGSSFSGMAMVVVQGDRVVLTRTYGLAARNPDTPIDPQRTRFLIGSITKTFTGLAVAQLVERGKIRSIDDPVNRYLKRIQLTGTFGSRITIRDLLTHSAGFAQRSRDVGTGEVRPLPVSEAEIRRIAPALVRKPGSIISYSNYGTGLLATMVEDVTGEPIERYFAENIWSPLGMRSAHFQKSLTLEPETARAYVLGAGQWKEKPFIGFHPYYWPVGAIGMTLADAARYVAFELRTARGVDSPVLSARMHAQLRSRLRANHPEVGGFGFLMMSFNWNGHAVFGHGGTWPGYESMMLVLPDQDTAVFFTIVGPAKIGNLKAYNMVMTQLLGPYTPNGKGAALSEDALRDYVGVYRPTMRAVGQVEGFLPYLGNGDGLHVTSRAGGLMIGSDGPFMPAGKDLFWYPKADTTASNPFGAVVFGFKRDAAGNVTLMTPQQGLTPYERVPGYQDPALRAAALRYLGWALFTGMLALFWRRLSFLDWLATLAAIAPPLAVFSLPFIVTYGLGSKGAEGYVLEGWSARFAGLLAVGDGVTAAALITTGTAIRWIHKEKDVRPSWNCWHVSLLALVQIASAVALWSVGLVGWR